MILKTSNLRIYLIVLILISGSCRKPSLPTSLPELTTTETKLGGDDGRLFINSGGNITSDGRLPIVARGVCWSTKELPTLADNKTIDGQGTGIFSSSVQWAFQRLTTYYFRAYATNSLGTSYGNQVSITTPCGWGIDFYFRSVILSYPNDGAMEQPTNPTLKWNTMGDLGTFDVYFDTVPDPLKKIAENITTNTLTLSGLDSAKTYYWKVFGWETAFPCNNNVSKILHFTTAGLPLVSTDLVTKYTFTSAKVGGSIKGDGGSKVTECGVFWGTNQNPDLTGTKFIIGSGTGSFSGTLNGLAPNMTYYVKAYATNSLGRWISYQVDFNTDRNTYLPTISTSAVIYYTSSTATVGGFVSNDGGSTVTERGIYWGIVPNPESTGTRLQIGSGVGQFSGTLSGLNPNTTYYVTAYATNQEGTIYGSQVTFNTGGSSTTPTVSDIDGNVYNTVKIGTQVWMVENLKTTRYADGTSIPLVNTVSTWNALTETAKAYCWYDDDISNKDVYGALYTWPAAMKGAAGSNSKPSGAQGACPAGWHLPSDAEWKELETYLGGGSIAGGKMKEIGTTHWYDPHWLDPNIGATNESGFNGLPGGSRIWYGGFAQIGIKGFWWSTTVISEIVSTPPALTISDVSLDLYSAKLQWPGSSRSNGNAVRCLKNY
jgi:uncharacterized protein (TIGR02145 family)